jgi:hypothetical protein
MLVTGLVRSLREDKSSDRARWIITLIVAKRASQPLIPLRHPHIVCVAHWQASITREPPKTKAELREMLTEAVRNTQPEPKRPPKAKRDRG